MDNTKKPLHETLPDAHQREALFRQIVEHISDAVVIVDREGTVRSLNPAAEHLFACPSEKLVGQPFAFNIHLGEEKEFRIARPGKDTKVVEARKAEIRLRGEVFYLINMRDITELVQLRKGQHDLPLFDELTDLCNLRGLLTLTQYQLKMTERTRKGMLLFFINLDNLKNITDTHSENEGNQALIEIADILRETFRASDILARIGPSKFTAIAVGARKNSAEILTERLKEYLKIKNNAQNRSYKLNVSMGIMYYDPENPCTIDDLLLKAGVDIRKNG